LLKDQIRKLSSKGLKKGYGLKEKLRMNNMSSALIIRANGCCFMNLILTTHRMLNFTRNQIRQESKKSNRNLKEKY
jgi:hypothetical protein